MGNIEKAEPFESITVIFFDEKSGVERGMVIWKFKCFPDTIDPRK